MLDFARPNSYNRKMMSIKEAFENFSFISYSAFAIYGVIAVYVVALLLCIKKKQDWMRLIP